MATQVSHQWSRIYMHGLISKMMAIPYIYEMLLWQSLMQQKFDDVSAANVWFSSGSDKSVAANFTVKMGYQAGPSQCELTQSSVGIVDRVYSTRTEGTARIQPRSRRSSATALSSRAKEHFRANLCIWDTTSTENWPWTKCQLGPAAWPSGNWQSHSHMLCKGKSFCITQGGK